ncbi:MAG TPA: DEAD/DEAH box helicase, partial [Candidatus Peribacteria bacterium]|nr:DEAD/DEAH box helicase [Candidatus Peribacteria bacterium]
MTTSPIPSPASPTPPTPIAAPAPVTDPNVTFANMGIAPKLLDLLEKVGFKSPTPIQQKSIPIGIEGKDIIGIAQTGTGKTLAFGLPMIQRL